MSDLDLLRLLVADLDLPSIDDLPSSVAYALAVREHLLGHLAGDRMLVGLAKRGPTPCPPGHREVVVAVDPVDHSVVRLAIYCGPVKRSWWAQQSVLVPLAWEQLDPGERRRRMLEILSAEDRADLDEQVTIAIREAAAERDDPATN